MANYVSGPILLVKGIVEKAFGIGKEVLGTVLGSDKTVKQGKAQQDAGEANRDAGKKEVAADKARAEAKAHEERQKANQ